MRTSTINYRVADFLKRHPPFDSLDEAERLTLASHGRVKMHERGEALFRQGGEPGGYILVIQQGTVRLVNEAGDGEHLHDILGAGDLLGIGPFLGRDTYQYTARAATDVVLYCLRSEDFEQVMATHPDVARYLKATASVRAGDAVSGAAANTDTTERRRLGVDQAGLPEAVVRGRLLTCRAETPIARAARQMAEGGHDALVVVDGQGLGVGLVTTDDLRDQVATARVSPQARVDAIMRAVPATALPGGQVGDYLLPMMQTGDGLVTITRDGTADTPVEGLVTSRDLVVRYGTDPAGLAHELRRAPSFAELATLHQRIRSLIAEQLTDTAAMGWLLPAVSELQRALIQRVVELATLDAAAEGLAPLGLETCWLRFGTAARAELLTVHDLDCGLVYADPPEAEVREASSQAEQLGRRVAAGLRASGFVFSPGARVLSEPAWCQPLSVWKSRYAAWIRDPILQQIYTARARFDLQPVSHRSPLLEALRAHMAAELGATETFIPVLANDTLAKQPPLTFFEGLVVDDEERQMAHLDIVASALQPLTDVGRVIALDRGAVETTSTWQRLELAARHHAQHRTALGEAAEAFRIGLLHRARAGLRDGHDGTLIDPASLTGYERTVLKSVFRAVAALLELAEQHYLRPLG